jgi:hypothetical protein
MPNFSHDALQTAIYQRLTADTTLAGLVTGIYDQAPQGTVFPYVTLGDSTATDRSTNTTAGTEFDLKLHAWSREGGRKQAAGILQEIYSLLHHASFAVTGQSLISIRYEASTITLESDGWTYQGIIMFKVFLQSN